MNKGLKQTEEQVLNILWGVLYSEYTHLTPTLLYYSMGYNLILPHFSLFQKIHSLGLNYSFEKKFLIHIIVSELESMGVKEELYKDEVLNSQLLE